MKCKNVRSFRPLGAKDAVGIEVQHRVRKCINFTKISSLYRNYLYLRKKEGAMIIGRRDELTQLRGLLKSYKSEFCAVYGRRRVGKTFLIREAFNYKFTFQHTGILDATKSEQISEFVESVHRAGLGKGFSVGHAFDIHSQVTMNDLFD